MYKPRGNPNWCAPQIPSSSEPTVSAFELETKKLGLSPDDFAGSAVLKEWARKNKDQRVGPSDLLQGWGFNSESGRQRDGQLFRLSARNKQKVSGAGE